MDKQERNAQLSKQVEKGLAAAYANMLAFKKYKNSPVIISRDGQILAVRAEDMPPPAKSRD